MVVGDADGANADIIAEGSEGKRLQDIFCCREIVVSVENDHIILTVELLFTAEVGQVCAEIGAAVAACGTVFLCHQIGSQAELILIEKFMMLVFGIRTPFVEKFKHDAAVLHDEFADLCSVKFLFFDFQRDGFG